MAYVADKIWIPYNVGGMEGFTLTDPRVMPTSPIIMAGRKLAYQNALLATGNNADAMNATALAGIEVIFGGKGYSGVPTVTVSAGTATATAVLGTNASNNDTVASITIGGTNSGYATAPTITIGAPTTGTKLQAIAQAVLNPGVVSPQNMVQLPTLAALTTGTVTVLNTLVTANTQFLLSLFNKGHAGTNQGTANTASTTRGVIAWIDSMTAGTSYVIGYRNVDPTNTTTNDWTAMVTLFG